MLYGMYVSAAGAMVQQVRQAVIANNIANQETDGYKSDQVVFRRRLMEAREDSVRSPYPDPILEQLTGGVFVDEISFSRAPGPLVRTGNPLDLALHGDGLFAVSDGQTTLYTRAGSFRRNGAGELVTADGRFKVLGTDGNPVRLPDGKVEFGSDGSIRVNDLPVGKLLLVGGPDPGSFEKVGGNYFRYLGQGSPSLATPEVIPSTLEGSDVSSVNEMARLIDSYRAYETNLQMVRLQDGSLARAVTELGRVPA